MDMEGTDISTITKDHLKDPFVTLSCMAIVSDPVCELSAQNVVISNTPYGSYSIHHIYLR